MTTETTCRETDMADDVTASTAPRPRDPAESLESAEDMAAYLEAALEEGDASFVATALGDLARARGMTEIAEATGLGGESPGKALSPGGSPALETVLAMVRSLGLRLHATAARSAHAHCDPRGRRA
jgi:probable addiction module antidote protein